MRLRALRHLQPVLDGSQKDVRLRECRSVGVADEPLFGETLQANEHLRRTDPRVPATVCQLECLCDKLDLPDASGSKLDVEPAAARLLFAVNPVARVADASDCLWKGLLMEDDAAKARKKPCDERFAASGRACANQHLPLPVVRAVAVVLERALETHDELAVLSVRPEAEVDAVDGRRPARTADGLEQLLGESREERAVLERRGGACMRRSRGVALAVVQKHQVDVGCVVELAAAELAERDDRELGFGDASTRVGGLRRAVAVHERLARVRKRVIEDAVGEVRQLVGGVRERREAETVAQVDAGQLPLFESREQRLLVAVAVTRRVAAELFIELFARARAVGCALARDVRDDVGLREDRVRKPWAVRGERQQVGEQCRRAFEPLVLGGVLGCETRDEAAGGFAFREAVKQFVERGIHWSAARGSRTV